MKPMGVLEIIDTSFRIYRQHFLKLLAINAVINVPYTIIVAALTPRLDAEASLVALTSPNDPGAL